MMLANTLPGVFMSLSNHTHPHDTIARGVLSKSVVCRPSCKLVASRARHPRHGILRVHASQDIDRNYSKTAEKALEVNLNPMFYGVLAEIGAGQEVARWFFQVGAAAGTVAKAISAYDMQISDATYGAAQRYVTRDRVEAMLEAEYLSCSLTLRKSRGNTTAFFAFADTVVAKAFNRANECHGWLGIKYQAQPKAEPNTVILHTRMLDSTAQLQQEALGVLGVNFIHSVLFHSGQPAAIIGRLLDDLSRDRIEVDAISFTGPEYIGYDNRVAALQLVEKQLCDAVLFTPKGELKIPHEALYKKHVLLMRGRFNPFTNLHNDMLMNAAQQFFCEGLAPEAAGAVVVNANAPASGGGLTDSMDECVYREDTLVLLEISTNDMLDTGDMLDWTSNDLNEASFLQRIEALATMGYTVLLSSYQRYFKLDMSPSNQKCIVLGVPSLKELFAERHYNDLDGGILENFGRLLSADMKLYVYPTLDKDTLTTANDVKVDPTVQLLYDYILQRGTIVPIREYNTNLLKYGDVSRRVQELLRAGSPEWESMVPRHVANQIKAQQLLGYRPPEDHHVQQGNGDAQPPPKHRGKRKPKAAAAGES